eukprot:jgi/Mesen1/10148/ME000076S09656
MELEGKAPGLVKQELKEDFKAYVNTPLDDIFQALFRRKMAQEVGWDSAQGGYDGLVEVARSLMAKHKSKTDTEAATVRILHSMFPPGLLPLFRLLIAPLGGGKPAALLTARVTQATCQWLMGPCKVNEVDLPDGSRMATGVLIERCRYLEETRCAGICVHTCKMPTQAFMKEGMGIPMAMEPNFADFSCQALSPSPSLPPSLPPSHLSSFPPLFKFGVEPPQRDADEALATPCLQICPTATPLRSCPQVSQV